MAVYNPFDFFLEEQAAHFPFSYEPALKKDLRPFLEPSPRTPKLSAFIEGIGGSLHGSVNVSGSRERRAREEFRGCGIGYVKVFGRGGAAPGAIHVVLKVGDLGGYGTAHT